MQRNILLIFGCVVAAVLALLFWFHGNPKEVNLAWLMAIAYLTWLSTVILSFFPRVASHQEYQRFLGTNEKRWSWLAALTFVFLIACLIMGRGQPMIRGVEEGLASQYRHVQESETAPRAKYIGKEIGNVAWNLLGLQDYQKALNLEKLPSVEAKPATKERPFYGFLSWFHWIIFTLLYLPTLVLYGIAMRREEVGAWIEERRRAREERLRQQQQAPQPAATSGQTQQPQLRRSWIGYADLILDLVDFLASLGAHFARR